MASTAPKGARAKRRSSRMLSATSSSEEPPKKRRRPSKVLSAKVVSIELQATYHKNATESDLLRLPPEVRKRIWDLVFGGRSIAIPDHAPSYICGDADDDYERARHIKARANAELPTKYTHDRETAWKLARMPGDYVKTEEDLHRVPTAEGLSLSLLRACRQIHQEAALLPFARNRFAFASIDSLSAFLRTTVAGQARHITSITLHERDLGIYYNDNVTLECLIQSKLIGLKQLVVILSLHGHGIVFHPKDEGEGVGALLHFVGKPLERAIVVTVLDPYYHYGIPRGEYVMPLKYKAQWKANRAWEAALERRLLGQVEEAEAEAEAGDGDGDKNQ